jgi:hypothetical protein
MHFPGVAGRDGPVKRVRDGLACQTLVRGRATTGALRPFQRPCARPTNYLSWQQ